MPACGSGPADPRAGSPLRGDVGAVSGSDGERRAADHAGLVRGQERDHGRHVRRIDPGNAEWALGGQQFPRDLLVPAVVPGRPLPAAADRLRVPVLVP